MRWLPAEGKLTFETRTTRRSGCFWRVYFNKRCETARPANDEPTTTTVLTMFAMV